jgi:hypothetical protein
LHQFLHDTKTTIHQLLSLHDQFKTIEQLQAGLSRIETLPHRRK